MLDVAEHERKLVKIAQMYCEYRELIEKNSAKDIPASLKVTQAFYFTCDLGPELRNWRKPDHRL